MFKHFVGKLANNTIKAGINAYLGKYLKRKINSDQFHFNLEENNVHIFLDGYIECNEKAINEALENAYIPFVRVTKGELSNIKCVFPFQNILESPTCIECDTISLFLKLDWELIVALPVSTSIDIEEEEKYDEGMKQLIRALKTILQKISIQANNVILYINDVIVITLSYLQTATLDIICSKQVKIIQIEMKTTFGDKQHIVLNNIVLTIDKKIDWFINEVSGKCNVDLQPWKSLFPSTTSSSPSPILEYKGIIVNVNIEWMFPKNNFYLSHISSRVKKIIISQTATSVELVTSQLNIELISYQNQRTTLAHEKECIVNLSLIENEQITITDSQDWTINIDLPILFYLQYYISSLSSSTSSTSSFSFLLKFINSALVCITLNLDSDSLHFESFLEYIEICNDSCKIACQCLELKEILQISFYTIILCITYNPPYLAVFEKPQPFTKRTKIFAGSTYIMSEKHLKKTNERQTFIEESRECSETWLDIDCHEVKFVIENTKDNIDFFKYFVTFFLKLQKWMNDFDAAATANITSSFSPTESLYYDDEDDESPIHSQSFWKSTWKTFVYLQLRKVNMSIIGVDFEAQSLQLLCVGDSNKTFLYIWSNNFQMFPWVTIERELRLLFTTDEKEIHLFTEADLVKFQMQSDMHKFLAALMLFQQLSINSPLEEETSLPLIINIHLFDSEAYFTTPAVLKVHHITFYTLFTESMATSSSYFLDFRQVQLLFENILCVKEQFLQLQFHEKNKGLIVELECCEFWFKSHWILYWKTLIEYLQKEIEQLYTHTSPTTTATTFSSTSLSTSSYIRYMEQSLLKSFIPPPSPTPLFSSAVISKETNSDYIENYFGEDDLQRKNVINTTAAAAAVGKEKQKQNLVEKMKTPMHVNFTYLLEQKEKNENNYPYCIRNKIESSYSVKVHYINISLIDSETNESFLLKGNTIHFEQWKYYPSDNELLYYTHWRKFSIEELEIEDRVVSSKIKCFLQRYETRDSPREWGKKFFSLDWGTFIDQRNINAGLQENLLIEISPCRFYIDQNSVVFLVMFCMACFYSLLPTLTENTTAAPSLYFHTFSISSLFLMIDYEPQGLDGFKMLGGQWVQLVGLIPLHESVVYFAPTTFRSLNGWGQVKDEFLRNIKTNAKEALLHVMRGVPGVRTTTRFIKSSVQLVIKPILHYPFILFGLQSGVIDVAETATSEICDIGSTLLFLCQFILETVEKITTSPSSSVSKTIPCSPQKQLPSFQLVRHTMLDQLESTYIKFHKNRNIFRIVQYFPLSALRMLITTLECSSLTLQTIKFECNPELKDKFSKKFK